MTSRRTFVKGISMTGFSYMWPETLNKVSSRIENKSGIDWSEIRRQFPISNWSKIHFNSGSAGVMPIVVRDYLIELIKYVNSKAPYEVWNEWQEIKVSNLKRLAAMSKCDHTELQVVRNTTEALNMIIYGLPLEKGDEVIISKHDYPFAVNAWKNRAQRDGIVLKEIDIIVPDSNYKIVDKFARQISDRTKAIHITHMTHREGHIMPVKELSNLASSINAFTIVDGAHIIGQIEISLHDLGCDYFASSLHKWLNAPHGTGLIYAKKDKISHLLNHPSSNLNAKDSMGKFEHIGTRAWSNEIGISAALDFHDLIGQDVKSARLNELKEYWIEKVKKVNGVTVITDPNSVYSCAVATFKIDKYSGGQIVKTLDKEYSIHAKSVAGKWGSGVRISVNIFTNFEELDKLVNAITSIANRADD